MSFREFWIRKHKGNNSNLMAWVKRDGSPKPVPNMSQEVIPVIEKAAFMELKADIKDLLNGLEDCVKHVDYEYNDSEPWEALVEFSEKWRLEIEGESK